MMERSWWYRFLFLIVITVVAATMIVPTVLDLDTKESSFPVKSKINLGLDLQGGLYMVLGIDFNKVYKDEVKTYARKIQYQLNDEGIKSELGSFSLSDVTDPRHEIILDDASQAGSAKEQIKSFFGSLLRLTNENGKTLEYGLATSTKQTIEEQSVSKSIEVIRNRIDEFGVTEPEILSQGNDRIIVQLPGVRDIERAKSLIGKTAKLEFKMVNDKDSANLSVWLEKATKAGIVFKDGIKFSDYLSKINTFLAKDLPKDHMLAFEKSVSRATNKVELGLPYLVEANAPLTGEALQDARVNFDQQTNSPIVSFELKAKGAQIFEELTDQNVGRRMAIILDGNVYSAPNIQSRIGGGRGQITLGTGGDVLKEARDLALVLRAGALPVQLDFLEQRSVGPSLGHDSIQRARYASILGGILVFLFIFIYYRMAGLIATITLVLNITFVLACLVAFEATLTLPGIAGIALTIGMAVDANIIIYERIREEVTKGVSNYKAVENGFADAFWTIIDANLTTALAGIFLFNFGTGPIKGFAVTLLIGIVATVYSSYFVGKLLFEYYMNKSNGEKLAI